LSRENSTLHRLSPSTDFAMVHPSSLGQVSELFVFVGSAGCQTNVSQFMIENSVAE
jgi:hypothetical protein